MREVAVSDVHDALYRARAHAIARLQLGRAGQLQGLPFRIQRLSAFRVAVTDRDQEIA